MEQTKSLDRFMGKSKEIEIEGQKFLIKALTVKDIKLIADLDNPDKRSDAMQKIISKILKDSIPEISEEQINNFSLVYLGNLMDTFAEVNNLTGELPKAFKERLKQK